MPVVKSEVQVAAENVLEDGLDKPQRGPVHVINRRDEEE
jgi:hypothetical protein